MEGNRMFPWTKNRLELEGLKKRVAELERKAAETPEETAGKRFQQGIDSILGYQWPPAKDGEG